MVLLVVRVIDGIGERWNLLDMRMVWILELGAVSFGVGVVVCRGGCLGERCERVRGSSFECEKVCGGQGGCERVCGGHG